MGDNFQKSAFTKEYAKVYDKFHASKNYQAEIEGIINLLPKSSVDVLSFNVLDYGCGTGKFSNVLSERGWNVTGYDISTAMLDIARSQFSSIRFTNNLVKYESKFDLAFSLFDVLSYQTTMSDATLMIEQIRDTMKKNSSLVLDTWQKKGVFSDPPQNRTRSIVYEGKHYSRDVTVLPGKITDESSDTYALQITVLEIESQEVIADETHKLRAWSKQEIIEISSSLGLKFVKFYNPKSFSSPSLDDDWRFGVILMAD